MIAAALARAPAERGDHARGPHVSGNVVVHHEGGRKAWALAATLDHGEAGDRQPLHVEARVHLPRAFPAIGAHRQVHDAGLHARDLIGAEAELLHLAAAETLHEHVGAGNETLLHPVLLGVLQIEHRRTHADIHVHHQCVVLEALIARDVEHLGPVTRERARGGGARDHMAVGEDTDARERRRRVVGPRDGVALADLDDFDDRDVGDGQPLRMRGPLRDGAVDAHDHPRLADHILKFRRVEGADALGDLLPVGSRADQREKADEVMRVDAGRCDQPAVLGLEHLEPERVAEDEGRLEIPAVQCRVPGPFWGQPVWRQCARGDVVVGEETRPGRDAVQGLAQVDAKLLRLAGALAPDGRGPDAARHGGNRHAGAKPESGFAGSDRAR